MCISCSTKSARNYKDVAIAASREDVTFEWALASGARLLWFMIWRYIMYCSR